MARIQPDDMAAEDRSRRPRAVRYAAPVMAVAATAATIGLIPALAGAASPNLPHITAKQPIAKVAASDTQTMSGTVRVSTDLGVPSFLTGATSGAALGGAMSSHGGGRDSGSSNDAADPERQLAQLLSGTHTLQVAADGPEKQKVSIVQDAAEYSLIHNGQDMWAYDSGSNSAHHSVLPKDHYPDRAPYEGSSVTPQAAAQKALAAVDDTTSVTVDGTAAVAGRDAYQLLIKPKQSGSTIGSIRIAVDSATGVPLKFTLTPSSGGKPAVDVGFTRVSFAKPAASTFTFTAPKGAKVTTEKVDRGAAEHRRRFSAGGSAGNALPGLGGLDASGRSGKGWNTVAELKAPKGALDAGGSESLLGSLGHRVSGDFGSGTVVSTRLINALVTDQGTVYVGAVDQKTLVKVAGAAAK
jgi:outer membrane lipoprotein-sorting protein